MQSDVVKVAPTGLPDLPDAPTRQAVMWDAAGLPPDGPLILASARSDWQLGSLALGDEVTITEHLSIGPGITSVITITVQVDELAQSWHVDELADAGALRLGPVALIAVDPDDPLRRIVVATRLPVE